MGKKTQFEKGRLLASAWWPMNYDLSLRELALYPTHTLVFVDETGTDRRDSLRQLRMRLALVRTRRALVRVIFSRITGASWRVPDLNGRGGRTVGGCLSSFTSFLLFTVVLARFGGLSFSLRSSCSKLSDRGERTTEQTLFPNTTEEHAMVTLSSTPLPAILLSRVFFVSRVEGVLFRALCLRGRGRRILAFFPVAIGCHLWYIAAVLHVILHCHAHSENNLYSGGSNLRYANNFPCVP